MFVEDMFKNREEAGEFLAEKIRDTISLEGVVVLGITRGGVVVAYVIASKLHLPFDCIVIKKIGAPHSPEFSIGAVGPEKTVYWDTNLSKRFAIPTEYKKRALQVKLQEQQEAEKLFHNGLKPLNITQKTVLLVDDGVATGTTVLCAQKYLKKKKARTILVTPVIANDTYEHIKSHFDGIIALHITSDFRSVSSFYQSFPQVENDEVIDLLAKARN